MMEDKLKETDWEVTQETIEEQVARESYLQWLRDNEKRATTVSILLQCNYSNFLYEEYFGLDLFP